MKRELLALAGAGVLVALPALALAAGQAPGEPPAEEETLRRAEEVTVESASKVETKLIDAPATMSVVGETVLATTPAQTYADLLRSVPGMNVIQTSARDMNLTTRQSTSTLNNSQLVLVDGRSVYLDFFGLVLWDFIPPASSGEIKQIEVVRGPASVVWGANALTGVVNVITKTPRENEGFGLTLGAGLFNRDEGSREADGEGFQYNGSFSYANAVNDTWSWKLSAGYFNSDPYSRPVGTVPLDCHPLGVSPCRAPNGSALPGGFPVGGAPYPTETSGGGNFVNNGTSQPKVDLRLDQDLTNGGRITYQGGYAGTEGIIHTGIGPFDMESGSYMSYGKVLYTKNALRVGVFANFVDASAPNLLQTDPGTLQPVVLSFKTQTYDVEVGNTNVVGGKHILTYGGNYRRNNFDITLAPLSQDRNEFGAYFQEEFFVSKFRLAAGLRADKFGNLDDWVFSPRVSVMFKPAPDHSLRASYNRAFRSPSTINNYLDQNIFSPTTVDLRALGQLVPPLAPSSPGAVLPGPQHLRQRVAEGGVHRRLRDRLHRRDREQDHGRIRGLPERHQRQHQLHLPPPRRREPQGLPGLEFYSPANPAKGVGAVSGQPITLSPVLMGALGQIPAPFGPILLPWKVATYLNLGPIRNRGFEASIEHRATREWLLSGNYSWQDTPEVLDEASGQLRYPTSEVGLAAKNRFNVGVSYNGARLLGNLNVNYSDEAFWNDVLNAPYHGYTDSYTMVNASVGVKLADGKATLSLRGTNILNQKILQHIYGDLTRRSVLAELRIFTK
jgi:outer membrane receptor protein involved in Fe transport